MQPILKSCSIEKLFICTVRDFKKFQSRVVETVQKQFVNKRLMIRSSSINEDRYNSSNAGSFISVNNINSDSKVELLYGIKKVINSYKKA